MTWIEEQIIKWQEWSASRENRVAMIPHHIQVGKVLESYPDIDDAIRFAALNVTVDSESDVFSDSYWVRVHDILLSYKLKSILEGSYEDNGN